MTTPFPSHRSTGFLQPRSRHRRAAGLAMLLVAGGALLAGCRSRLAEGPTVAALGPYAVSDRRTDNQLFGHDMAVTLTDRTLRFRFIEGEQKGQTIDMVYTMQQQAPLPTCRRRFGQREVAHLCREPDGRLVMTAIENRKHDVITRFDPALPILLPDARCAQPRTFSSYARVFKTNNLQSPWDEGPCTITLEYDGRQTLDLPAGRFDCRRLRVRYQGKFKLASVHSLTIAWYAPQVGLVAQHYSESGRFLFVPWTERYTMILEAVESHDHSPAAPTNPPATQSPATPPAKSSQ